MANKYVDCDGHVMEDTDEIIRLVGEPFKTTGHMNPRRVLPSWIAFIRRGWKSANLGRSIPA